MLLASILLNCHVGRIVLRSMCVGVSVWLGWSGIRVAGSACNTDTTPAQPHRNSNIHRTKNKTTNVVIQQNSRKLLMMYILMSETCWAHKKWNNIASDIKLVFYSSTITVMHGPINIRFSSKLRIPLSPPIGHYTSGLWPLFVLHFLLPLLTTCATHFFTFSLNVLIVLGSYEVWGFTFCYCIYE